MKFITWSIIVEHDFDGRCYIHFFLFYIFVCCIPNYTMFVYLLEFKKIISFSFKEDLVSKCLYIDIKVDNFVYMYITYFRIRKLKFIFSYTYIYIIWIFLRECLFVIWVYYDRIVWPSQFKIPTSAIANIHHASKLQGWGDHHLSKWKIYGPRGDPSS